MNTEINMYTDHALLAKLTNINDKHDGAVPRL